MGAGVAGLQAIATARRLGAIVSATDVRPAAKEQVESLGANFVAVEDEEFKAGRDRRRLRQGDERRLSSAKQAALIAEHIKKQDIVITTALIPGRTAPVLVSEDDGQDDEAGLGHRRSRGRAGRQLPAVASPARSCVKHGVKIVGHAQRARPHRRRCRARSMRATCWPS